MYFVTVSAKCQAVLCLCGSLHALLMPHLSAKYWAYWRSAALTLVLPFVRTGVVDALCSTQQLDCLKTALAMAKWSFPLALANTWSAAHSSLSHLSPSGHVCFAPCHCTAEQAAGRQFANQHHSKLNMCCIVCLPCAWPDRPQKRAVVGNCRK